VMGFGGMAVMTSKRHKTGTDRILEAIQGFKCDIVVNIQGDEPFVDAKDIDDAIKPLLKDKTLNVSTLGVRMNDGKEVKDPHSVKVVFNKNNDALYFSRSVIPYSEKPDVKKDRYYKHIGLYVYRKKFLEEFGRTRQSELEKIEKLEQLRILEMGEKIRVVITKSDSFGVDTKADLNAYAKIENQAGCCSPSMNGIESESKALPTLDAGCCAPAPVAIGAEKELHTDLAELLRRYNVNDYAASVRVFAVKED